MNSDSVSVRLRRAREMVPGLSARELDRLAGVAEGTCAIIEKRDQRSIHRHTAESYSAPLGVSLAWLAFGEGPPPDPAAVQAAVETARAAHTPEPPEAPADEPHAPVVTLPFDEAVAAVDETREAIEEGRRGRRGRVGRAVSTGRAAA